VPGGALTIGIYANFEAFDFADVKIITNCWLNKLYFMQYYTELYIHAENPDLLVNKTLINNINAKALFFVKMSTTTRFPIRNLIQYVFLASYT
jgi:hypothetical protein